MDARWNVESLPNTNGKRATDATKNVIHFWKIFRAPQ